MKIDVEDLKRIKLKSGDTLVMRVGGLHNFSINTKIFEKFKEDFKTVFPENKLMVIYSKDIEIYKVITEG